MIIALVNVCLGLKDADQCPCFNLTQDVIMKKHPAK